MAKKEVKQDDQQQAARFIADAQALQVDESGKGFQRTFKVVIPKSIKKKKNGVHS